MPAMNVLGYAVAGREVPVTAPGVAGVAVSRLEIEGLHVWYDEAPTLSNDVPADALRFHAVISELFRQTAVVPFRFPTLFLSQTELVSLIRERRELFRNDLDRLEGKVQMEVIVGELALAAGTGSGTAYMEQKFEQARRLREAAQRVRSAVSSYAVQALERELKHGTRLFFLVLRNDIDSFMHAVGACGVRGLRTTGPWPPTAFLSKELAAAHV